MGLVIPEQLTVQGLVLVFIAGMPMAGVFLLPKGLTADIADYDALLRGERREAMFYSTQNFFEKVTYALPPLFLSLILQLRGFCRGPAGHPTGAVDGGRARASGRCAMAALSPARHRGPGNGHGRGPATVEGLVLNDGSRCCLVEASDRRGCCNSWNMYIYEGNERALSAPH